MDPSIWTRLEEAPKDERRGWATEELQGDEDASGVRLGIDLTGHRHLLVPIPLSFTSVGVDGATGLTVQRTVRIDEQGESRAFLDASVEAIRLRAVFDHLVDEVVARLEGGQSGVAAFRSAVHDFRDLFAPSPRSLLGVEAAAGLVGELLMIRRLVDAGVTDLACWTGPMGGRHDLVLPGATVEVKSTLRRGEWRFRIASLDQLERQGELPLFLVGLRLEESPEGSHSLPGLVRGLIGAGCARSQVLEWTRRAGYDPADDAYYDGMRFFLRRARLYDVEAGFPRLRQSDLLGGVPTGVREVSYSVDATGVAVAEEGADLPLPSGWLQGGSS